MNTACTALVAIALSTSLSSQTECVPPTHYGEGTPGTNGLAPLISSSGRAAREGDYSFGIDVSLTRAFAPVGLAVSTAPGSVQFLGANLALDFGQILTVVPSIASSNGHVRYEMPVPAQTGITGFTLYLQALTADPFAPQGLTSSQGLAILVCDSSPQFNARQFGGVDASCTNTTDSGCTDLQPALPSFARPTRTVFEVTAIRFDTQERVDITRIAGVGAALDEDYANMEFELFVFADQAQFGASNLDPADALYHTTEISLVDTAPAAFGGQSPIGVSHRYLEFEFEEFELGDPQVPMTYWISIVRTDSGPDGFVWAHTITNVGNDIQTSSSLSPTWIDNASLGLSPGSAAVDVFARPVCASYQSDFTMLRQEVEAVHRPHLAASSAALGVTICAPLFVVEYPFESGPPFVLHEAADDSNVLCSGLPDSQLEAARAAVVNAALEQTDEGATSAWLCVIRQGDDDPLVLPVMLSRQVCTPILF